METAQASGRRLIDGRFELVERLGGGGMGLVWRAWDVALHREVALKEVRTPEAASPGADPAEMRVLRERVLREARALARLQHPNVVTIYHIVDSAELQHPWLVMELVAGGSLDDRLQDGPVPVQDAIRIGRGVLSALQAAHAAGIQHRDVKPANVLLRLDGTPVLTDFGIAALSEAPSLTMTGTLIGSPEYMAPERIRGQEGNPASDLWSLGMLLYVAVEGRSPLRRETSLATLAAVLDAQIPPPVRSGSLAPVLAAVLTRDPAARPDAASLDRLLAAAGHARDDPAAFSTRPPAGYQPPPRTTHARASSRPRRNGSRRTLAMAAAAALGLAGVLAWVFIGLLPRPGHHLLGQAVASAASTPVSPSTGSGRSSGPAAATLPVTAAQDLLTPTGVPELISELRRVTGGTKFKSLVIYPTMAVAQAPTKGDRTVYDNYLYRNGAVSDVSPGGALSSSDVLFDPAVMDWGKLPGLIRTADARLGVPHPTERYVMVLGDFPGTDPALLVYVGDSYRTAYLVANSRGNIVRMYPFTPSS